MKFVTLVSFSSEALFFYLEQKDLPCASTYISLATLRFKGSWEIEYINSQPQQLRKIIRKVIGMHMSDPTYNLLYSTSPTLMNHNGSLCSQEFILLWNQCPINSEKSAHFSQCEVTLIRIQRYLWRNSSYRTEFVHTSLSRAKH